MMSQGLLLLSFFFAVVGSSSSAAVGSPSSAVVGSPYIAVVGSLFSFLQEYCEHRHHVISTSQEVCLLRLGLP